MGLLVSTLLTAQAVLQQSQTNGYVPYSPNLYSNPNADLPLPLAIQYGELYKLLFYQIFFRTILFSMDSPGDLSLLEAAIPTHYHLLPES